jgi:small nuclear ribonucleoprotein (snRNP)-like protein
MLKPPGYVATAKSDTASHNITQTFLNKQVLVQVSDGRFFQGLFVCVDHECNTILQGAYEYQNEQGDGKRWFGMVMIPGKHLVEIKVKAGWTSALSQESSLYI